MYNRDNQEDEAMEEALHGVISLVALVFLAIIILFAITALFGKYWLFGVIIIALVVFDARYGYHS